MRLRRSRTRAQPGHGGTSALVASLVGLGLAVVGCGGNPAPTTLTGSGSPDSPSASAAPTSTPKPGKSSSAPTASHKASAKPSPTKAAKDNSKNDGGKGDSGNKGKSDGGKVVVNGGGKAGPAASTIKKLTQQFLAADNHASKTGDYAARDKLTSPSCAWCAQKKAYVEKIYSGGGKVTGELFTHNHIDVQGPNSGKYFALITTTVSKYKEVDGNGRVIDSHGDRTGLLSLTYAKSGSSWKVVEGSWSPNS